MITTQAIDQHHVPSDFLADSPAAESLNRALDLVTHEVRTPLTALHVSLELLASQVTNLDPGDVQAMLVRMQRSLAWIHSMIENLSAYARLQTGRLGPRCTPVRLLDAIESTLVLLQPVLDQKGQRVRLQCPTPNPVVNGDRQMIEQVFLNLLTNANKYSCADDVIEVEVRPEDCRVRISVTDHGPGIAKHHQALLFNPYTRAADPTNRDVRGLGLGLFIVKTLVDLHGGSVGLESVPGRGATFWCTFPAPATASAAALSGTPPRPEAKLDQPMALAFAGVATVNRSEDA